MTPFSTRQSRYNGASLPPRTGGGDDGGGRDDGMPDFVPNFIPNYGERLRRARMGLAVAMTPIIMLFVSFTAVYLVRRGFVSVDMSETAYVRNWVPVQLPWAVLLVNTAVLILSSFTIDLARRDITREAALAPVQSIPGITLGDERHFPWLGLTTVLGLAFSGRAAFRLEQTFRRRLSSCRRHQQFIRVHTYCYARNASGGRRSGAHLRRCRGNAASSSRESAHHCRHYVVVLALHDGALDLHCCAFLVCGAVSRFRAELLCFITPGAFGGAPSRSAASCWGVLRLRRTSLRESLLRSG